MHMSGESLLVIIVVGVIAGWLAGQIVQGTGFGLVGDFIIGVVGAFIASWLLPQLWCPHWCGHGGRDCKRDDRSDIAVGLVQGNRGSGRYGGRGWRARQHGAIAPPGPT